MNDGSIDISVIIPAFNEEKRISQFLEGLAFHCQSSFKNYEIIVVNDGSVDGTRNVLGGFRGRFRRFVVIEEPKNRGKGAAVRDGMLKAKGAVRLYMDADGSYAPSEIENQLHYFQEGYDVVIGSRFVAKSSYEDAPGRSVIRTLFRFLVTAFLFRGIRDTQCGFKFFSARSADKIFPELKLRGFGFDLEALYLARQNKFSIKEAAVRCTAQEGSKVRVVRDSLTLFADIFRIRFFH